MNGKGKKEGQEILIDWIINKNENTLQRNIGCFSFQVSEIYILVKPSELQDKLEIVELATNNSIWTISASLIEFSSSSQRQKKVSTAVLNYSIMYTVRPPATWLYIQYDLVSTYWAINFNLLLSLEFENLIRNYLNTFLYTLNFYWDVNPFSGLRQLCPSECLTEWVYNAILSCLCFLTVIYKPE